MGHLFISAAHKSSGKTTLSIGLCAAFRQRGLQVQPFKKGPDYIDPMWLSRAAGKDCYNLDFHTQSHAEILTHFGHRHAQSDISIIEGNKGLYDGLDLDGSNSNAALATLLNSPVILVIDAQGMTRGIAPLILGYQAFEPDINIAGVILNQLGGSRHETKLRAVIEHYTNVPVVGAVHRDPLLKIQERHLGLIPSNEAQAVEQQIDLVAKRVAEQVNLDQLQAIADSAPIPDFEAPDNIISPATHIPTDIRIGIARDAAFGFYYPDDLEAFRAAGAELVNIDTLTDTTLPEIDGLFIGGGFPETHMQALSANTGLRTAIRNAIESGLPVYAECGGLMYLSRSLKWNDNCCDMVGALDMNIHMHQRPQGRGYVKLAVTGDSLWNHTATQPQQSTINAHEFHYSAPAKAFSKDTRFAYRVLRGHGVNGTSDGIVHHNVLANYSHMRDVKSNPWVQRFVAFVRQCTATRSQNSPT
ncbi:MAG: cobyrinate a,c-diamide synthase [Ectothiorhodospiraceae bacterium]|nr:cobyrinate a,c-diamide synthase [Ectothiorhodospiraceae bacterium]